MNYTYGSQNVLLYLLTGSLLLQFIQHMVVYTFWTPHHNLTLKSTTLTNKSLGYMHFSLTLITNPMWIKKNSWHKRFFRLFPTLRGYASRRPYSYCTQPVIWPEDHSYIHWCLYTRLWSFCSVCFKLIILPCKYSLFLFQQSVLVSSLTLFR